MKKIQRALISVAKKDGLLQVGELLKKYNVEILASDGTHGFLSQNNISSIKISDYTKFPEILDGRVKTLNPLIFAGILAKSEDEKHSQQLKEVGAKFIDLVIVDLYDFKSQPSVEKIDIGGSALIRAAAKNFNDLIVITNNDDYAILIEELEKNNGSTTLEFRRKLAQKAFKYSIDYDSMIHDWLSTLNNDLKQDSFNDANLLKLGTHSINMRYGENPNQNAIFKTLASNDQINFTQLFGKEMSYNNILDAHAAIHLCYEFEKPTIVIVKHNNPCCVASGKNSFDAYKKAIAADKESSFGGIVAANSEIDGCAAQEIIKIFTEVVIAPKITEEAMQIFSSKPNLRVLIFDDIKKISNTIDFKPALGGVLIQDANYSLNEKNWKCVTEKKPNNDLMRDATFAYKVSKHVKSNAIVFATNEVALAIGPGQTSRVQSTRIAMERLQVAKENSEIVTEIKDDDIQDSMQALGEYHNHDYENLVMASDGFLPFADSLEVAIEAKIKLVIQPGGSLRDQEVIDFANKNDISMIFTGQRIFKH
jgi:phosphoribosylaminoimidazolecarboxamide formyltransferase/IMP cyclohydrolase